MAVFVETSAYLRLLFKEKGANEMRAQLAKADRVVASRLLRIEAERAVLRAGLDHPPFARSLPAIQHEMKAAWAGFTFLEITREICDLAGQIAPGSMLRSLDAIHLATYRKLKTIDPELTMLTVDERLLRELG